MSKKIMQTLILLLALAVIAACGSDAAADTDNYYYNNGNEAVASPTPPIVIHQATPQPTPAPQAVQPQELTREHFLADLEHFVDTLEAEFLHFGVVYRRFGVDFRQNAAYLRAILADEDFEVDADIFTQLMLDNFFMHPDITYSVAGWHFDGQSQRSDGFTGTSGHVEISVLEEGRIGLIRINCFELRGLGVRTNTIRNIENFFANSADFEHIIVDVRGVDGSSRHNYLAWSIIWPNIVDEQVTQTYYMFMRDLVWLSAQLPAMAQGAVAIPEMAAVPPELDLDAGLIYGVSNIMRSSRYPDAAPFAGQMWLLIDSGVGGVAAEFAEYANHTGVATLVGQPVGGDMPISTFLWVGDDIAGSLIYAGGSPTTMRLPNTQIPFAFHTYLRTDAQGRAVDEYVTQPHVLVPEDVDALEYLLEMIGWADNGED